MIFDLLKLAHLWQPLKEMAELRVSKKIVKDFFCRRSEEAKVSRKIAPLSSIQSYKRKKCI